MCEEKTLEQRKTRRCTRARRTNVDSFISTSDKKFWRCVSVRAPCFFRLELEPEHEFSVTFSHMNYSGQVLIMGINGFYNRRILNFKLVSRVRWRVISNKRKFSLGTGSVSSALLLCDLF